MSEEPAALSHAVRVSFPDGAEAAAAAGRLARCWPDPDHAPGLWQEDVAAAADAPGSARRRAAELTRPIGPGQPPARWVLLRYANGAADLIVVCLRGFLTEPELGRLALLLAAGPDKPVRDLPPTREPDAALRDLLAVAAARAARPAALSAERPMAPSWGFGDRRACGTSLVEMVEVAWADDAARGDLASWQASLSVVMTRYEESADGDVTLGEVAELFRRGEGWPGGKRSGAPVAGVRFEAAGASASRVEYNPGGEPEFPLTLRVTGSGVACHYRPASFAPEVARQF